jgi:hypothetical protein
MTRVVYMEQNLPHIRRKPERINAQPCLSVCKERWSLCMGQSLAPLPLCIPSPLIHNGLGYNLDVKTRAVFTTHFITYEWAH